MEEKLEGRLVRGMGGLYTVRDGQGNEYVLRARGRFRRSHITPLVGDRVLFLPGSGDQHGWLDEILPRTTVCLRPPVANVEKLVIVVAPQPQPDLLLVDRMLVRATGTGIRPVLCLNKTDLDPGFAETIGRQYAGADMPVLSVSAKTGKGLDALYAQMEGAVCCLSGQSAVGKSSLVNALCGLRLQTGELSEKILRGRHTTRHAELLEAKGLMILDTPGFSLLTLEDETIEPEKLAERWPEFAETDGACRFSPCCHDSEPGCAVRAAVEAGTISRERWERYCVLLREVRETWNTRYTKRF